MTPNFVLNKEQSEGGIPNDLSSFSPSTDSNFHLSQFSKTLKRDSYFIILIYLETVFFSYLILPEETSY